MAAAPPGPGGSSSSALTFEELAAGPNFTTPELPYWFPEPPLPPQGWEVFVSYEAYLVWAVVCYIFVVLLVFGYVGVCATIAFFWKPEDRISEEAKAFKREYEQSLEKKKKQEAKDKRKKAEREARGGEEHVESQAQLRARQVWAHIRRNTKGKHLEEYALQVVEFVQLSAFSLIPSVVPWSNWLLPLRFFLRLSFLTPPSFLSVSFFFLVWIVYAVLFLCFICFKLARLGLWLYKRQQEKAERLALEAGMAADEETAQAGKKGSGGALVKQGAGKQGALVKSSSGKLGSSSTAVATAEDKSKPGGSPTAAEQKAAADKERKAEKARKAAVAAAAVPAGPPPEPNWVMRQLYKAWANLKDENWRDQRGGKLVYEFMFCPAAKKAFDMIACVYYEDQSPPTLAVYPAVYCWTPLHWSLVIPALLLLGFYIPMVLRYLKIMNSFDPDIMYIPRFMIVFYMLQFVMTGVSTLSVWGPLAAGIVVACLLCCLLPIYAANLVLQPCIGDNGYINHTRSAVMLGASWCACCAGLSVLIDDPRNPLPIIIYLLFIVPVLLLGLFSSIAYFQLYQYMLMRALKRITHESSHRKQVMAASNIGSYALSEQSRKVLMRYTIIPVVADLLKTEHADVQAQLLRAYTNLMMSPVTMGALLACNVEVDLLSMVTSEDEVVRTRTARVIWYLCFNLEHREIFAQLKAIPVLLHQLEQSTAEEEELRQRLIRVLCHMCIKTYQREQFAEYDGVNILCTLCRDIKDRNVLRNFSLIVRNLSRNAACQEDIMLRDNLGLVLKLCYHADAKVADGCQDALRHMSSTVERRMAIEELAKKQRRRVDWLRKQVSSSTLSVGAAGGSGGSSSRPVSPAPSSRGSVSLTSAVMAMKLQGREESMLNIAALAEAMTKKSRRESMSVMPGLESGARRGSVLVKPQARRGSVLLEMPDGSGGRAGSRAPSPSSLEHQHSTNSLASSKGGLTPKSERRSSMAPKGDRATASSDSLAPSDSKQPLHSGRRKSVQLAPIAITGASGAPPKSPGRAASTNKLSARKYSVSGEDDMLSGIPVTRVDSSWTDGPLSASTVSSSGPSPASNRRGKSFARMPSVKINDGDTGMSKSTSAGKLPSGRAGKKGGKGK